MPVTLILGGARSGKSRRAQQLAEASGLPVCYLATAPHIDGDEEWQARIAQHQAGRPEAWRTVETGTELVEELARQAGSGRLLLVDCLTLWLSNLLLAGLDTERESERLVALLPGLAGEIVLVSNEVGMGLVPEPAMGRAFRDAQGRLNQAVAAAAGRVEFVAAGIPLLLKNEETDKEGTE